jgi:hypothetical protein
LTVVDDSFSFFSFPISSLLLGLRLLRLSFEEVVDLSVQSEEEVVVTHFFQFDVPFVVEGPLDLLQSSSELLRLLESASGGRLRDKLVRGIIEENIGSINQ